MTPGINIARKAGISHTIHEYSHEPGSESYGTEAADKLGLAHHQVFKTLVAKVDGRELVVAVVPVSAMLSLKQIARAAGGKKATMAEPTEVERSTGYVLGGVSPLGQKKRLRTFIDDSATTLERIHVSAGRRGLEIELAPGDLQQLTGAQLVPLQQA